MTMSETNYEAASAKFSELQEQLSPLLKDGVLIFVTPTPRQLGDKEFWGITLFKDGFTKDEDIVSPEFYIPVNKK